MNRISRGYLSGGRNAPAGASAEPSGLFRRNKSIAGAPSVEGEDTLDLFFRTRRIYSISSSGESDVVNRMEKKASIGFPKAGRDAADEFLSADIGKHDYDWLLTPPGTPLFSSVESTNHHVPSTSQRSSSNLRPTSLVKSSRSENHNHDPRMARSSSSTRASFSTSSRTPSSVLNTSSASVNSRPTTPSTRTRTSATTSLRPTTLRPTASHSTTPARARPSTNEKPKPVEKPKPTTQLSRPSTPTTRAHLPTSSTMSSGPNSIQTRPNSRPSTPTRRAPPLAAANSRPSSPMPRSRAPTQPILPPDLPFDAPSNLRAKLPERVVSVVRQRPGMKLTVGGNSNVELVSTGVSSSRRASSPDVARGLVVDNQSKARVNGNRDNLRPVENQKPIMLERKPVKPSPGGEIGAYGRTMSKNSLNMALKHMTVQDIRQGAGGVRGASLFPHSIRSATAAASKDRPASKSDPVAAARKNDITVYGGYASEMMPKNYHESSSESRGTEVANCCEVGSTMKAYGSSRYDSILLQEDSRSLNWLRSLDPKPGDHSRPFDHSRSEPLPELFMLL